MVTIKETIILVLVLILPTIGGIEWCIPTRLTAPDLLAPVFGVFTDNFVAASASLGVVVVRRNSNNVRRIDLDDHSLSILGIKEVGKICDGAEVQAIAASAILVLVNLVALHLADGTNRIVECARMYVLEIGTNILEREEVTILCEWQLTSFKEVIQLIHSPLGRIVQEIVEEVEHGLERQVMLDEFQNALCERVVNRITLKVDDTIFDEDVGVVNVVTHLARQVHQFQEQLPIAVTHGFDSLLVIDVVCIHSINCAVYDSRNFTATCDSYCIICIHTFCVLLCFVVLPKCFCKHQVIVRIVMVLHQFVKHNLLRFGER
jgi:hypothetical protein